MLCIPGDWEDRKDFLIRLVQESNGEFMLAGSILAQPKAKRHVTFDFYPPHPRLRAAFEAPKQFKHTPELLGAVEGHRSIIYLHFGISFILEREKIITFTKMMRAIGGIAVKVESSGLSYGWEAWFEQVSSDEPFDWYRTLVIFVEDNQRYYSCGMHLFQLPDVEVPRSLGSEKGADLINSFNFWRISSEPDLKPGHTFSVSWEGPRFRLEQVADTRHDEGDLFHNEAGLWRLEMI